MGLRPVLHANPSGPKIRRTGNLPTSESTRNARQPFALILPFQYPYRVYHIPPWGSGNTLMGFP
jgi:hypothetical protein